MPAARGCPAFIRRVAASGGARQGWSRYVTDYGINERHHQAFLAAEDEARREQRGCWAE